MNPDPLQQLRDVHLPADPAWFPPAPGWWLLAALLLIGIGCLIYLAVSAHRRRAPIRAARRLLDALYSANKSGELSASSYVQQTNETLKRLLAPALGMRDLAPLSGRAWLARLDSLAGAAHFSEGAGQVLGDARFAKEVTVDADALHQHLEDLLARLHRRLPI